MAKQMPQRPRLTIDIEPELLREIKIQAIRHDESVKDYVTRIVLEELDKLEDANKSRREQAEQAEEG